MNLKDYFSEEEIKKAERIIIQFHDRFFLDKKINNTSGLVICTYMMSNNKKKGFVDKKEVKDIFIKLGRTEEEFSKSLYEINGKRVRGGKRKTAFIDEKGEQIGLNLEGLDQIKKILDGKNG